MSQRVLTEVVSQYLEAGGAGAARDEDYLTLVSAQRNELEPLLGVIRLLRTVLVPVEPSPEFVAALRARLATTPIEDLPLVAPQHPARLVVGAVALGSIVSAAAVYYLVSRGRAPRAA